MFGIFGVDPAFDDRPPPERFGLITHPAPRPQKENPNMLDTYKDCPYAGKVFASADAVPLDQWTWDNFRPHEFACKGTGKVLIDPYALDCLQILRNMHGSPITLTSAYRSPAHNKAVGGAQNSYHKQGRAFDIPMSNIANRHEFLRLARKAGFTGFGFYPPQGRRYNFMHVDTGPKRYWGQIW